MTGIELLRQLLAANPDSLHQEVMLLADDGQEIALFQAWPEFKSKIDGREKTMLVPEDFPSSPFTLVRHPDTARLDWLERRTERVNGIQFLPGGSGWRVWESHGFGVENLGDSTGLRTAIDTAMTNHPEIPESCAGGGEKP